jgi:hypothetical protein
MTRQRLNDTFALTLKVFALVAAIWAGVRFVSSASANVLLAQSSAGRIDALTSRVARVEEQIGAVSYMTCVSFAETHPANQVPTYCDSYTRPK